MAISYPLSLAQFAGTLGIARLEPQQMREAEYSGLGSGEAISADLAPARRRFTVSLASLEEDDASIITARLELLEADPQATFYIADPRYIAPASDPTGASLTSSTVQIKTLNSNTKALSLKGLPSGFVINIGDRMAWDYGSSPYRRAYHRAMEPVTADGSGDTEEFEVRDFIRPGSVADAIVTLINPAFKAQLVRGSVRESADGAYTALSFAVQQVL